MPTENFSAFLKSSSFFPPPYLFCLKFLIITPIRIPYLLSYRSPLNSSTFSFSSFVLMNSEVSFVSNIILSFLYIYISHLPYLHLLYLPFPTSTSFHTHDALLLLLRRRVGVDAGDVGSPPLGVRHGADAPPR